MERESFVFYRSFYEAIDTQPKNVQLAAYRALFKYALYGETSDLKGIVRSLFLLMKPQVDANNKRFETGKLGGRPKKNKTDGFENDNENKTDGFEESNRGSADGKPNENVNDNENVNVNGKENVNDNAKGKSADMKSAGEADFESVGEIALAKLYPDRIERTARISELLKGG